MNDWPILLVEDSEDDVLFMQRGLQRAAVRNRIVVLRDGRSAVSYLAGEAEFADRSLYPLPGLMFLDIKLPYLSGLEVLEWMNQQPALRKIPVVILTSSSQESDVDQAYRLGANSYLVKPSSFDRLSLMLQTVAKYWLDFNRAPSPP